jgi:transcriptional regulator with XRE-family HTH domain
MLLILLVVRPLAHNGQRVRGLLAFLKLSLAMTTDEVINALGRYRKDSKETDRQMATKLGINRMTLSAWLRRKDQPQKCALARLAGFLRRVG